MHGGDQISKYPNIQVAFGQNWELGPEIRIANMAGGEDSVCRAAEGGRF